MELNRNHRESLLTELEKVREELELAKSMRIENLKTNKAPTPDFSDWCDVKIFLLQQRAKLIEKSLVDNEIDY